MEEIEFTLTYPSGAYMRADAGADTDGWSFHHVYPVWMLYLAAATLIWLRWRVVRTDNDDRTLLDGLRAMAGPGRTGTLERELRWLAPPSAMPRPSVPRPADPYGAARLCTSPAFAGFAGPEGGTREFDAGRHPNGASWQENAPPLSAPATWWESLGLLGNHVHDIVAACTNGAGSPAGAVRTMTYRMPRLLWIRTGLAIALYAQGLTRDGMPAFDPADWSLAPGGAAGGPLTHSNTHWTFAEANAPQQVRGTGTPREVRLRLRRDGAPVTYRRTGGGAVRQLYRPMPGTRPNGAWDRNKLYD